MEHVKKHEYIDIDEIRDALDNNEFEIYYQPQVNKEGEIIGVEALARWFSEKYGIISPDIFIPIIESNNIIYNFHNYVFEKACKQIRNINEFTNKKITLSINISPIQLKNKNFVKDIKNIIEKNNIDYEDIKLEITESYPLNKIKELNKTLNELKQLKIKILLDDFGKGYNSIKYLLDFHFDEVKIDKKYINMSLENPKFIYSMIKMIHSVGSKVVSEGIENKQQAEIVKILGSDIMQGYYFYKPICFNEILKLV